MVLARQLEKEESDKLSQKPKTLNEEAAATEARKIKEPGILNQQLRKLCYRKGKGVEEAMNEDAKEASRVLISARMKGLEWLVNQRLCISRSGAKKTKVRTHQVNNDHQVRQHLQHISAELELLSCKSNGKKKSSSSIVIPVYSRGVKSKGSQVVKACNRRLDDSERSVWNNGIIVYIQMFKIVSLSKRSLFDLACRKFMRQHGFWGLLSKQSIEALHSAQG
uniref:Uncharacterized protein n=1 Tax=Ditylenchus dipsaci TaxID=166011 RepID=A0A915D881_9BILA